MKRVVLLLLTVSLGGCLIVTPTPAPTPLNVLSATYQTNAQLTDGTFVICDNTTTTLIYKFRYEGELESWTSYLQGQKLGRVDGRETFTPGSENVSPYEQSGFEVTYTIPPTLAPYHNSAAEGELSPQAIEVVPVPQPTIIGASKLHLILQGANGDARPYISDDIPVIINCPTS